MALNRAPDSLETFVESTSNPPLKVLERRWPCPSVPPRAAVLLLHGFAWHSAWFNELAKGLAANAGALVHAIDFLSHGKSDSIRGRRGLFLDYKDLVDDAHAALRRLRASAPSTPVFVLGESMGGIVALLLALKREVGPELRGLVLCGAALRVHDALLPPWPMVEIAKLMGAIFPTLPVPGDEISGETWDEAFGDPEARKLSKEDPLVSYGVAMHMGCARTHMIETASIVERAAELQVGSLMAMHYVGDTRVSFQAVQDAVNNAVKVECRELVPFEGTAHQLFQDVPEVRGKAIDRVARFVLEKSAQ